jgi:hypothetical protein
MFNTRNKSGISAHPCIILYIISSFYNLECFYACPYKFAILVFLPEYLAFFMYWPKILSVAGVKKTLKTM